MRSEQRQVNPAPGNASSDLLARVRNELAELLHGLGEAEERCARIAELPDEQAEQAEQARAQLAEARSAYSEVRLKLLKKLDRLALDDPRAASAREALGQRYVYASKENVESLLALIDGLSPPPRQTLGLSPEALSEQLAEAMRLRNDNKKSAAAGIGIATKTLDRMLEGKSVKPAKQRLAERYVDRALTHS